MYGGLIDRVHDLLLCGVDPYLVDLSTCLARLESFDHVHVIREMDSLLRAASHPWTPSHHAFLYGTQFKTCIASLCLVKVRYHVSVVIGSKLIDLFFPFDDLCESYHIFLMISQ